MSLIVYLISINVLGFVLCFIDKVKSIKGKYRISERILIIVSFLGGCFGMVIGMNLFRHKTKKLKFKFVSLLSFLYLVLLVYLYVK